MEWNRGEAPITLGNKNFREQAGRTDTTELGCGLRLIYADYNSSRSLTCALETIMSRPDVDPAQQGRTGWDMNWHQASRVQQYVKAQDNVRRFIEGSVSTLHFLLGIAMAQQTCAPTTHAGTARGKDTAAPMRA
jgi:hypothetical protein